MESYICIIYIHCLFNVSLFLSIMDFSRGQYVIYGPVRIILTENEVQGQYNHNRFILIDYYMTFSILALVSARDCHIKPDSAAGGLIWVESWYQGRYGKFHVIIYLSHILHWLFSSIDFYMTEKIFEKINCEYKSLRELPLFNLQIFLLRVLYKCVIRSTQDIDWHLNGNSYSRRRIHLS